MLIKVSRSFKDISLSFSRNPITSDLIILKNEDAIKKSVMNLIKTNIGDRFFNSLIGTGVQSSLFELSDRDSVVFLEEQIRTLLNNYEPRINLRDVILDLPEDTNELYIQIQYDIIGLPRPAQTIEFILQPTRA